MSVELAKKAPAKPAFKKMNEHLVCSLCKGYLVDATTIVECLHSYCRSCIVRYLQASSFCPTCEVQLHKGSPLRSLKPDKTLQDIVYKLVPNLFHNEMQRRRVYYDTHPQYADQTTPEQRGDCLERFYSPDDSVSLSLEYHDRRKSSAGQASPPADDLKSPSPPADGQNKSLPPKRYLKCPALFTIGLLKKFIRLKFDLPQELVIDIFQRRESLADEYTLLDIAYIYPWKTSEPMKFFYRVRDPRVPESDEEVEREMPSLSAAVGGRATRASRRASSASSLASPLGSPRGSPVPSGKRSRPDIEEKDKDSDKQDPTPPPPARLTAQPPTGTAVHPKPVAAKPLTSPTSPGAPGTPGTPGTPGPKITLTISPSRGIVTSATTEPDTPKSPPPTTLAVKPATPSQTPALTAAPVKKNGTAAPAAVKNGPVTPKTPSFAATVTTKTANGGFVTVKNPIARPPNGVTVGNKTPASPQHIPTSPKMTPILPKPAQGVTKAKRLTNGLPLLAPKADLKAHTQSPQASPKPPTPTAPAAPSNTALPAAEAAAKRTLTSPTANSAGPNSGPTAAPTPKPAASPAPGASKGPEAPSAAQKKEEEKKTMETAKAILQLSMGFKQSRSDTPTDSTLHNHIDKIVKDLDDDESNDGTLVIKSEPSSPASSGAQSPVPSPNPQPPATTSTGASTAPAALPPTLPKVNGLTITPIEPGKRKATNSPSVEEKRPRMEQATAGKRPAEGPLPSPAAPKQAKVDKIAESIKLKQELLLRQQEGQKDKKAAAQQPQPGGQSNALRPVGNSLQAVKPALNSSKPSSPLTKQPLSSPTTLKSFPPAQMKPIAPKPVGNPANAQGKPLAQAAATTPGQSSATMAARAGSAAQPSALSKAAAATARPTSAPQSQQDKLSQQTAGKPTSGPQGLQPKPGNVPQAQVQAKSTAVPPARSPSGAQGQQLAKPPSGGQGQQQAKPPSGGQGQQQAKPPSGAQGQQQAKPPSGAQGQQQAKPAPSQQGQQAKSAPARQGQQAKSAPSQQGPQQAKPDTPQQGQPAKPTSAQQGKQATFGPPRELDNTSKMAMEARKRATPSPQRSPQQSAVKSPESKSKKPIPDLQRLQRPPLSLTGTTVNGCVSLAEVKEQLAKKGQYSPPPAQQQQQQQPNKTPPRLIEISQRKSAPPAPAGFGALDLSSASPRASDHGGSWTPPPSLGLAQALAKRQQLMMAPQGLPLRPPPSSLSSLSSSSPSPPADSPGSAGCSISPDLFLDPAVFAQHQAALLHQLQLQSLFQTQAGLTAGLSAGLKKTIEEWDRTRGGVRATAKRK